MSKLSDWSNAIKSRDGKCIKCGKLDDLHSHHIKPKSMYPELMFDLSNGITLCYSCHKKEHENNRPIRSRGLKPQRKTILKKLAQLETENLQLKEQIREMHQIIIRYEKYL